MKEKIVLYHKQKIHESKWNAFLDVKNFNKI